MKDPIYITNYKERIVNLDPISLMVVISKKEHDALLELLRVRTEELTKLSVHMREWLSIPITTTGISVSSYRMIEAWAEVVERQAALNSNGREE